VERNSQKRGVPTAPSAIDPCGQGERIQVREQKQHRVRRDRQSALCRGWFHVPGPPIDQAVERLFLQTMVPHEIELSLAVEREVEGQADSLDKAWRTRLEQARYEARRAER
jgi:hypothetical protein